MRVHRNLEMMMETQKQETICGDKQGAEWWKRKGNCPSLAFYRSSWTSSVLRYATGVSLYFLAFDLPKRETIKWLCVSKCKQFILQLPHLVYEKVRREAIPKQAPAPGTAPLPWAPLQALWPCTPAIISVSQEFRYCSRWVFPSRTGQVTTGVSKEQVFAWVW